MTDRGAEAGVGKKENLKGRSWAFFLEHAIFTALFVNDNNAVCVCYTRKRFGDGDHRAGRDCSI